MHIFLPAAVLAIYTIAFYFYMGLKRRKAVLAREMDHRYYSLYAGGEEPPELRVLSRHAANLLEMPMLFYAVVIMIHSAGLTSTLLLTLAWLYVALRFVHACVHLGGNVVLHRFLVFGVSLIVLLAMWVVLLIRLVVAPA